MKKSLVALAALAVVGAASAQSSVTLSGNIKGGYAWTTYSGGAAAASNGHNSSMADGSSRFIISGREDLGGGMAGIFQIDTRFRVDDNGGTSVTTGPSASVATATTAYVTSAPSQLASGNSFVGVTGGFGSIRLGKLDTHYCTGSDEHGVRATALQASSCGILGYVQTALQSIANASRATNIVRYDLPSTMMAGVTGGVSYSSGFLGAPAVTNSASGSDGAFGAAGKGRAYSFNLGYAAGPLKLAASYWNAQAENRDVAVVRNDQKAWTVTGGWNFGVGTVGLTYDRSAYEKAAASSAVFVENRRTAWSVPVTFGVGAGTILATYTKAGAVSGIAASGAKLWSVGYDHALSKRTSVGISYAVLTNDAAAAYQLYTAGALQSLTGPTAGQDQKSLYLGLRHAY